ncbi:MAG: hypothetical protein KatS3mg104_1515 [Phycisphaerae bacterium]|nr:MAG: hypothetical protein KatS3mg104_1515 [Phycisphaerae bacterium]
METRSPLHTSGIRMGTAALTTRGLKEPEMAQIAGIIDRVFRSKGDESVLRQCREEVLAICARFPMKH